MLILSYRKDESLSLVHVLAFFAAMTVAITYYAMRSGVLVSWHDGVPILIGRYLSDAIAFGMLSSALCLFASVVLNKFI